MKKTAVITLCKEGVALAFHLNTRFPDWELFVHNDVKVPPPAHSFTSVLTLSKEIFKKYNGLVYIMPCGVVVRAIAEHIEHKKLDPAVVCVDVGGRFAVSLLSGHEGGANDLTLDVANCIGAEPVISTTTEAVKTITVGVGCRKNTDADRIVGAIRKALAIVNISVKSVRFIASAEAKRDEAGLIKAAAILGIPLRIVPDWQIRRCGGVMDSPLVQRTLSLPAVAEPAALTSGKDTVLLLNRQIINGVTVAIAQERSMLSE
jgi:cobalt-precorrin 5A hydrolase